MNACLLLTCKNLCERRIHGTHTHTQREKMISFKCSKSNGYNAEGNVSLFADSCANSSNKKSMNQGSQYIPITKICHFLTTFFLTINHVSLLLQQKNCGRWERQICTDTQTINSLSLSLPLSLLKKVKSLKNACSPTWSEGIWLWQTKHTA